MSTLAGLWRPSNQRATSFGGKPLTDPALVEFLSAYSRTASGMNVTEISSWNYSAVFCAVTIISQSIGLLPRKVYQKSPDRGRVYIDDHPVATLLKKPNREQRPLVFFRTLMGHVLTWGNAYAEIEYNNRNEPIGLWPRRPDRVTPKRNPQSHEIEYEVQRARGGTDTVAANRIIHLLGPSFDGLRGESVIGLARQSIGLSLAAERFGATFFGNGSRPGGAIKMKGALEDEEATNNLRKSLADLYEGPDNWNKIAILEEGMDWEAMGISNEDSQFLETRKFQTVEIARWFNIPPHLIKDLERATFSNIEAQGIDFVQFTLLPWAVAIEQEFYYKLLVPTETPSKELYIEHSFEGYLRGDSAARAAFYKAMRDGGAYSSNDIRRRENESDIGPQGDIYLVPANMVNAQDLVDGKKKDPAKDPPKDPPSDPDAESKAKKARVSELLLPVFSDIASRMVHKEQAAIRRMKPETMAAERQEFFRTHESTLTTAFGSICEALAAFAFAGTTGIGRHQEIGFEACKRVAADWCASSRGIEPEDVMSEARAKSLAIRMINAVLG